MTSYFSDPRYVNQDDAEPGSPYELVHYGVKGMKWGRRKQKIQTYSTAVNTATANRMNAQGKLSALTSRKNSIRRSHASYWSNLLNRYGRNSPMGQAIRKAKASDTSHLKVKIKNAKVDVKKAKSGEKKAKRALAKVVGKKVLKNKSVKSKKK